MKKWDAKKLAEEYLYRTHGPARMKVSYSQITDEETKEHIIHSLGWDFIPGYLAGWNARQNIFLDGQCPFMNPRVWIDTEYMEKNPTQHTFTAYDCVSVHDDKQVPYMSVEDHNAQNIDMLKTLLAYAKASLKEDTIGMLEEMIQNRMQS